MKILIFLLTLIFNLKASYTLTLEDGDYQESSPRSDISTNSDVSQYSTTAQSDPFEKMEQDQIKIQNKTTNDLVLVIKEYDFIKHIIPKNKDFTIEYIDKSLQEILIIDKAQFDKYAYRKPSSLTKKFCYKIDDVRNRIIDVRNRIIIVRSFDIRPDIKDI